MIPTDRVVRRMVGFLRIRAKKNDPEKRHFSIVPSIGFYPVLFCDGRQDFRELANQASVAKKSKIDRYGSYNYCQHF